MKNGTLSVREYFESDHYFIYLKWFKKIYKNLWIYFQLCRINVCNFIFILEKDKI